MGVSTNKKVLVSRFERETLAGFVNPQTWLQPDGMELLTTDGAIVVIAYGDIRTVYFVRDFEQGEPRKDLRTFNTRPKQEGLWLRLRLRNGDLLDGIAPNNPLIWEAQGFSMIPPDPSYQNQRIFVPRAAVEEAKVLGVLGSSPRGRGKQAKPGEQLEMFNV